MKPTLHDRTVKPVVMGQSIVLSAIKPQKLHLLVERTWADIEPQDYSPTDYSVSKKLINPLRHGSLLREDDGAIEFWRMKDYFRNHFVHSRHWPDEKWKSSMAGGGGNKKRFQYCTDSSGARNSLPPSSSRSFRTQTY